MACGGQTALSVHPTDWLLILIKLLCAAVEWTAPERGQFLVLFTDTLLPGVRLAANYAFAQISVRVPKGV
jgi:hypothetical protein